MQISPIPPSGFGFTPGHGPLDPKLPLPTTSGTGTAITAAYDDNSWSHDSFLEVTGPATSGPIPHAFASKQDAIAAAAGLSHGTQPALAVLYDPSAGPRGSTPWIVQALQIANPQAVGFIDRASRWHHTGWRVGTELLDLESGNLASSLRDFVAAAPFTAGVAAIVDGAVIVPVSDEQQR